jgi:insulysin
MNYQLLMKCRFAQFFIAPLFPESGTEQAVIEIDAKHDESMLDDETRSAEVLSCTADPSHPFSQFSNGEQQYMYIPLLRSILFSHEFGWMGSNLEGRIVDHGFACKWILPGNRDTLWKIPREKALDVRGAVVEFHRKYYSANLMSLVVLGSGTLDELQDLV